VGMGRGRMVCVASILQVRARDGPRRAGQRGIARVSAGAWAGIVVECARRGGMAPAARTRSMLSRARAIRATDAAVYLRWLTGRSGDRPASRSVFSRSGARALAHSRRPHQVACGSVGGDVADPPAFVEVQLELGEAAE